MKSEKVTNLHDAPMHKDLARSGLTPQDARRAGMRSIGPQYCKELFGVERTGYLIPYFNADGTRVENFQRIRFTDDKESFAGKRAHEDSPKYMQTPGTRPYAYFPPIFDWEKVHRDGSIAIVITEGEKKAFAACKAGIPCIALGGVWSFKSSTHGLTMLPELLPFFEGGRKVIVMYDSDIMTKKEVAAACTEFGARVMIAGARVHFAYLPNDPAHKVGIDDYLMEHGADELQKLLDAASPISIKKLVADLRKATNGRGRPSKKTVTVGMPTADERNRLIAELIHAHAKANGLFIKSQERLLYFAKEHARVVSLHIADARMLLAILAERSDVTGACPEWSVSFERLANEAAMRGADVKLSQLARYVPAAPRSEGGPARPAAVYVAASDTTMFRVTEAGYVEVSNGTDGVIMHTRGRLAPVPRNERRVAKKELRRAFDRISNIANFKDGDVMTAQHARLLWSIFLFAPFFPELLPTRVVPLFHGVNGSRKTSSGRAYLLAIFGDGADVTTIRKDKPDALSTALANNYVLVLDNVDGRYEGAENAICVAATGGYESMREYYTTLDEKRVKIDCFLIATSREPRSFTRVDVVERVLYLPCERKEGEFKAESEIKAEILADRANWWEFVLDTIPKVLANLKKIRPGKVHDSRMADFSKFAQAVGTALGYSHKEVTDALDAMSAEKVGFLADNSGVVEAVRQYVEKEAESLRTYRASKGATPERFNEQREALRAHVTATTLLNAVRSRVPNFKQENATHFGTLLQQQKDALAKRLTFTTTYSKKKKGWTYSVEPLGGYETWEEAAK